MRAPGLCALLVLPSAVIVSLAAVAPAIAAAPRRTVPMGRRVKEPPPPEPLTQADMDADGTLAQLLLSSATIERQTDACLDLACTPRTPAFSSDG